MSLSASARSVPGTLRQLVVIDGRHHLVTDEPVGIGGGGSAPAPHELFPATLETGIEFVEHLVLRPGTLSRVVDAA
jgi:hypothetical protein